MFTLGINHNSDEQTGRTIWDLVNDGIVPIPVWIIAIVLCIALIGFVIYFLLPVWDRHMEASYRNKVRKYQALDQQIRVLIMMQSCLRTIKYHTMSKVEEILEVLYKVLNLYRQLPSYTSKRLDNKINDFASALRQTSYVIGKETSVDEDIKEFGLASTNMATESAELLRVLEDEKEECFKERSLFKEVVLRD